MLSEIHGSYDDQIRCVKILVVAVAAAIVEAFFWFPRS